MCRDRVVEEDESKAFALYEKAAAQNHIAAMYMVADCLLNGVSWTIRCWYRHGIAS